MNRQTNAPTPCLILIVGAQAAEIALDAQTIYLRSNPWRASMARFLALKFTQAKGDLRAVFTPLKKGSRAEKTSVISRRQIYDATLQAASELRDALETALHDLRTHEQTMLSGAAEKHIFSIKVLLLADMTRLESAAIFPLLALLDDLLSNEMDKQVLLLLNVAQFSNRKDAHLKSACCHAGLRDLNVLLTAQKSPLRDALAQDLALPDKKPAPDFAVFLFDRYKENGWEVKDENELQILMANFVLAVLTSGLTVDVAEALPYHSAAATALVYNPEYLIEACAARGGLEFLEREFDEAALPDLGMIDQVTDEISAIYGDLHSWLETLINETAFSARAGDLPGVEIHFSDLRFDDLPVTEWSYAIQGYDIHFGQTSFPFALEKLNANAQSLSERISLEQADALATLPRQARLYPGGLSASRKIIAALSNRLRERGESFAVREDHAALEEQLAQHVEDPLRLLDQAVSAMPQPPRWFSCLPFSLEQLAKHLFAVFYLYREHALQVQLRQQAIYALEIKYAVLLETKLRQIISRLSERLAAELDYSDQEIQAFQAEVEKAHAQLEAQNMLIEEQNSIFRPSAVDEVVLAWAYEGFKKPVDETRFLLFDEQDWLLYWSDTDWHNLKSDLLRLMRGLYQPLWTFNSDQILAQHADLSQTDAAVLWATLSQGAVPLLRPDFDLAGSLQTFQTQHFLCASPRHTVFGSFLHQPLSGWEPLATGDATLTMCLRMRHLIPSSALATLFSRGQADFEKLPESERSSLRLFAADLEQPE